jgi:hypothetical protein
MCEPDERADERVTSLSSTGCGGPTNVADALRMVRAAIDYLNSPAAGLDPADLGGVLAGLGTLQAKLTAAHARALRQFDGAHAYAADGYGSSAAWLAAMTGMTRKGARAAMDEMRQLRDRPDLAAALADGQITKSLGPDLIESTKPAPLGAPRQDRQNPAGSRRRGRRR